MDKLNFEEYRQPWETGLHWELKREFLEKYHKTFPEERLLCLAQAYSNIELMDCSYPEPLMLQIHELSKSLQGCKRFREAKKNLPKSEREIQARSGKSTSSTTVSLASSASNTLTVEREKSPKNSDPILMNYRLLDNSFQQQLVVLYHTSISNQTPQTIINNSMQFCKKSVSYEVSDPVNTPEGSHYRCDVMFEGESIGLGIGASQSEAKRNASVKALQNLQNQFYTIKIKNEVEDGFFIHRSQIVNAEVPMNVVSDNNIGCKMLKKMGWSSGSLGNSGGITEPIVASEHRFHQGFGFSKGDDDLNKFRPKIEALLKEFILTETTSDLIFSSDFTKEERKDIHGICDRFGFTSKSRGKGQSRQLLVRPKWTINQLLNQLVKAGGCSSKYELVDESSWLEEHPSCQEVGFDTRAARIPQRRCSLSPGERTSIGIRRKDRGAAQQPPSSQRRRSLSPGEGTSTGIRRMGSRGSACDQNKCDHTFQESLQNCCLYPSVSSRRWAAYVSFLTELYLHVKCQNMGTSGTEPPIGPHRNSPMAHLALTLHTLLYECANVMLKPPSLNCEGEIEILLKMLITVGKQLESDCSQRMQQLVVNVRDAFINPSISAQIRKTLLEVIELDASDWQLNLPQTLYYFLYTRL